MNRELIQKLRTQLNLLGSSYSNGQLPQISASGIISDDEIEKPEDEVGETEDDVTEYQRIIRQMEDPPPAIKKGKNKGVIPRIDGGLKYQVKLNKINKTNETSKLGKNASNESIAITADYCTKAEANQYRQQLKEVLIQRYRHRSNMMPLNRSTCEKVIRELVEGPVYYRPIELTDSVAYGTKVRYLDTDGIYWRLQPAVWVVGTTPTHLIVKDRLKKAKHHYISRHHLILVEMVSPWGRFTQRTNR